MTVADQPPLVLEQQGVLDVLLLTLSLLASDRSSDGVGPRRDGVRIRHLCLGSGRYRICGPGICIAEIYKALLFDTGYGVGDGWRIERRRAALSRLAAFLRRRR